MSLRAMLLFAVLLPSLPVCLGRPFYGIVLWTIIGFVNPQWYAWGASTFLPTAEAVAIPTLIGAVFFARNWRSLASKEVLLMLVMYLWFTVTSVVAASTPLFMPHAVETWERWGTVSKILLMTCATIVIVDSFQRLRKLLIVLTGCISIFVLKGIPFIFTTGGNFRLHGPEKTVLADNNDFGLCLNMTLPFFFFLAQTEQHIWVKRFYWALFIFTIPCIFFTYSRGAMVGLCVIMLLMMMRLKQRVVLIPVLLAGVAIAALFAPEAWKDRMNPSGEQAMDKSAYSRINAWNFAWNLVSEYPITGGGFATFTTELFERYAPNAKDVHGAHSVYFGVLGEHGFPGFLLYMSLVIACFFTLHWIEKRARIRDDDLILNYVNMLRLSLVGFLVCGCFLGRAYFDYYFTLVAFVVILKSVAQSRWREMENEQYERERWGEIERPAADVAVPMVAG